MYIILGHFWQFSSSVIVFDQGDPLRIDKTFGTNEGEVQEM